MEKKNIGNNILKLIGYLLLVVIILVAVNTVRNYIIISQINEKQISLNNCENYSYVRESYSSKSDDEKTIIEVYYKDGRIMLVNDKTNKIIMWHDNDTKEFIVTIPNELKAIVDTSEFMIGAGKPIVGEILPFNEKLSVSIFSFITNNEINGEKCYCINRGKSNITYISKKDGIPLKEISGYSIIDGKKYNTITEIKNWKTNELSDEDMSRPNLTGYEITKK